MKIKYLLFFGLLFTIGKVYAQKDFRAGYIIKCTSDTLFGEIDYRGDLLMGERCLFRLNEKEKETIFSPNEILGYRFNDSKYFVSKEVNGKNVFLEFLIKGQIDIYYLRDSNGDHYFLGKEGSEINEIPYEEREIYSKNTSYQYKSTQHIGFLYFYMQDAPGFQSRIAQIGKPEHANLIKLAEDYHNKVCKDGGCIIYEKRLPLLKFDMEIAGGIVDFINSDFNNKRYFQAGILAHLWMPRTSEKLYFRTGLLYSTLKTETSHKSVYKIPLQFEYNYPKGRVIPKIALGVNIYSPYFLSVALMGGVNVKLHKSVSLSFNYDIDFNPDDKFPILPKNVLSQSIVMGLLVKL